jgi:hypothetical protein
MKDGWDNIGCVCSLFVQGETHKTVTFSLESI